MATQDHELINSLIATYRELNTKVRSVPEERLAMTQAGSSSVRTAISQLRDNELKFSQSLKEAISGVPMPEMGEGLEVPVLGTETGEDVTNVILSQFGTARESTLAMLRGLPSAEWDTSIDGNATIRTRTQQQISRDKRTLEQVVGLLGAV